MSSAQAPRTQAHFRLTGEQTILRARNRGNAAVALDESEETMPTEEKPSRNEHEYFVKRDAELILERRTRLDLGLIRR